MRNPLSALLRHWSADLAAFDASEFCEPAGEPALASPDSVSWRVFRNPVTMYLGGVLAVLLELAEPRVAHAVWAHSDFRRDPAGRLRRTGHAAMVTAYAAASRFERLAERVRRMHEQVLGRTAGGQFYSAEDPQLLLWVQTTAAWAFVTAYEAYARPLGRPLRDAYYAEGAAGARLFGVEHPPLASDDVALIFSGMKHQLVASAILEELVTILRTAPILPRALRPLQPTLVAAAIGMVPPRLRKQLQLRPTLTTPEKTLLLVLARAMERTHLPWAPYALASERLGLASDHVLHHPIRTPAARPPTSTLVEAAN